MVATPGDPDEGVPSDPTNGALIEDLGEVAVDIAYGGSCTAGKEDDLDMYAAVMTEARAAGLRVADGVEFFIQFGSADVEAYARDKGYLEVFEATGVRLIKPGCGACIGCGPGVSETPEQVSVSAINRNFQGRSGPGRLYLASPPDGGRVGGDRTDHGLAARPVRAGARRHRLKAWRRQMLAERKYPSAPLPALGPRRWSWFPVRPGLDPRLASRQRREHATPRDRGTARRWNR